MASNCSNNLLIAPAVVSFSRNSQIGHAQERTANRLDLFPTLG
jgi:hypothetical protein